MTAIKKILLSVALLVGTMFIGAPQASAASYPMGTLVTQDSSFPGRPCQVQESVTSYSNTLGFYFRTVDIPPANVYSECKSVLYIYPYVDTAWFVQLNYLWVDNSTGASTVVSYPLKSVLNANYAYQSFQVATNNSRFHWASPNLRLWRCTAPGLLSNPPTSTANCVIFTVSFT